MSTCTCPTADLWEADRAQLCTATPGELHPCPGYLTLCPPENGCTDAIAHRCQDTGWHTANGGTISDWYRRDLLNLAIETKGGPKAYLRVGTAADGEIAMHSDTNEHALAVAAEVLRRYGAHS